MDHKNHEILTTVFLLFSFILANAQNDEFFTKECLILDYPKNSIHTQDFNNDNFSDIAIALNITDGVLLLLNDTQGVMSEPVLISNGGYSTRTLSSGNIKNDGNMDFAIASIYFIVGFYTNKNE
jgi:hypothetical protein